jgi:integrase
MSVFQRGNVWWYTFHFAGRRIQESTGSTSKNLAIKAERQRRREMEESANGIRASRRPALFRIAAKEWFEANRAHWGSRNVSIQEYSIKHLSDTFGAMLVSDIDVKRIGKYQHARQQQGASNRTCNMETSTLRMILKSHKLWTAIADEVKMLPERKDVGRALSPDEETRLLAACKASPSRSLHPAVCIYSNSGLRNAELRCARWSQVDFLKKEFHVGLAKTEASTGRIVPLNQAAMQAFKEWRTQWPDAQPTDYIFPSEKLVFKGQGSADNGKMVSYAVDSNKPMGGWKRAWKTAKKQAGVECRIHDLRHGFVSKLAETQTPDAIIQALAGHLTKQMQERYSHIRQESKRQAVALLDKPATQTVQ